MIDDGAPAPPAEAERAVDMEVNLERVAGSLTGYARAALDQAVRDLALERWAVTPRIRLRDAKGRAGFLRMDLRLVATRTAGPLEAPDPAYKPMTEEHHTLIDMADLPPDPALVAGMFQAAVTALVDVTAPRMSRRLQAEGVLEHGQERRCAGALCVGCGATMCPRAVERRAACDHGLASGNRGAIRCTVCGSLLAPPGGC
jgi:hypothetical protein